MVILLGDVHPPALVFQVVLFEDELIKIVEQGPVTVKYTKNVLPLVFNTVFKTGATQSLLIVCVGVGVIKQGFCVDVGVGVGVGFTILQGFLPIQVLQSL
jgi:hypothetical protein